MGKLEIGTTACFISFYVIALPLSYTFAFKLGFGLMGLWYGVLLGLVFLVIAYQYIISMHYDWYLIAKEASVRQLSEGGDDEQKK